MKRILLSWVGLSLLLVSLFTISCATDGTEDPGGNALGPEIRFLSDAGFISADSQVSPGETFKVKINAVAGDADLKSLTIKENGTNVPLNRLTITVNGTSVTNNPLLIVAPYTSGATWEISIAAPADAAVRTYEFVVTDQSNLTASVDVDVEVFGQLSVSLARGDDDVTVLGKSDYAVSVIGTRGASALSTLSVLADGELVPADSLLFGGTGAGANPIVLVAAEKTSFDSELVIKTESKGTKTYTLVLTDESGATVSVEFDLTVLVEYTALIINNRDGLNLGGLDLDNGQTVAYNSSMAEIRDKGIDLAKPASTNWYQQILPVNGASIKIPDLTQAENFSYANANTRADIVAAYETGIAKTETDKIEMGYTFLVKRDNDYFLMQCTSVNVTAANNADYYEFNVKQVLGKE